MDSGRRSHIKSVGGAALAFFLRFLAASVALYIIYTMAGSYYMRFVASIANPLLSLYGIDMNMQQALRVTEEISLNPVVFLSLVIAMRRVAAKKKLLAAITGVAILTAANAVTVFLAFLSAHRGSETLWTGTEFFNLTMNFFVPLLLWITLLPSQAFSTMRGAASNGSRS